MPASASPVTSAISAGSRAVRQGVLRASSLRSYDEARTIVVAGTPRSGTTWLGQMIATLPRTAVVFEPLRSPAARAAGVGWHTVEGTDVDDPREVAFVRDALRATVRNRWTMRGNSTWDVITARTWILKEVRINRILPWMMRTFGLARAVLLVRDPVAVVASQIAMADGEPVVTWLGTSRERVPAPLVEVYPWLGEVEVDPDDATAQLALQWALDQLVPLWPQDRSWTVIDYDALRVDPRGVLGPLLQKWGFAVPDGLEAASVRPSSVTRATPSPNRSASEELSDNQQDTIRDVCDAVGIEVERVGHRTTVRVRPDRLEAGRQP